MGDYKKLLKTQAREFYDASFPEFEKDTDEFGGESDRPNFSKWLDRTGKLSDVVEKIVSGWTLKDYHWVQSNTRNPNPYGDPRSNAFGSFYSDMLQEVKKLKKKSDGS